MNVQAFGQYESYSYTLLYIALDSHIHMTSAEKESVSTKRIGHWRKGCVSHSIRYNCTGEIVVHTHMHIVHELNCDPARYMYISAVSTLNMHKTQNRRQ